MCIKSSIYSQRLERNGHKMEPELWFFKTKKLKIISLKISDYKKLF